VPTPTRTHLSDLRGIARLAVDASEGITGIVEHMHRTVQSVPLPIGKAKADRTRGITGFVYRSVRGGMRVVGRGIDMSLAPLTALLPEGESTPARDAFLSAANGVFGDYLARTGNPLALEMELRARGRRFDPDDPTGAFEPETGAAPNGRLLLLVHGLCLNDQQWTRDGHDHGKALADEFGFTPLYLRYNSGLHIAANGRSFADLLECVTRRWPVPVEELVILGHSMGGLVARSACHHGREAGHAWLKHLRKLVFLGTPHHGAPLERGGHGLDFVMDLSPYSAPFTQIGKSRSAGIRDLRHGTITGDPSAGVPLPESVRCYAVAATLAERRGVIAERLLGDGLVPLDSALGRHSDPARTLELPKQRQWIGYGMGHLELLSRPEVYAQLSTWLASHPRGCE
jgi:pimeloyl-ACP methyl ester carboxylesterase